MRIVGSLYSFFFTPRYYWSRFQLSLFGLLLIYGAFSAGVYFAVTEVVFPHVFAATSPWTQTDWSGGTASGTVTGTVTTYESGSDVDVATAGEINISAQSDWYNSNWTYRKAITIDSDQVSGSSDLVNFPVLINTTDSDWADTSNGGNVEQSDGGDILFTSSNGTSKLDHEIETYTNTTGELVAWVEVPTVDYNDDTTIYIYYGNDAGSLDESNATGVWDSNYVGVWHLDEEQSGTGNSDLYTDSTSNTNHGDDFLAATGQTGKIGAGQEISGVSNDYIDVDAANTEVEGLSSMTLSAWIYPEADGTKGIVSKATNAYGSGDWVLAMHTSERVRFIANNGTDSVSLIDDITLDAWNHVVVAFDSGSTAKLYINGSEAQSADITGSLPTQSSDLFFGKFYTNFNSFWFDGFLDDIRISSNVRSADWIATEYNNQNTPGSFYSVGSEDNLYPASATLTSNIFDAESGATWGTLTYNSSGSGTVTVKVRTDSSSDMSGATAWGSCTGISSSSDISSNGCVDDEDQYLQYQVTLEPSGINTPTFEDISIAFVLDSTPPHHQRLQYRYGHIRWRQKHCLW